MTTSNWACGHPKQTDVPSPRWGCAECSRHRYEEVHLPGLPEEEVERYTRGESAHEIEEFTRKERWERRLGPDGLYKWRFLELIE